MPNKSDIIFHDNEIMCYRYFCFLDQKYRTYVAKWFNERSFQDLFFFEGYHPTLTPDEVRVYIAFM